MLNSNFYTQNRNKLKALYPNAIIVSTAYDAMQLSGDMAAPFLQEACFRYLTGIDEPKWRLIIDTSKDKSWLVAPVISDVQSIFDGNLSHEDAKSISGVDGVLVGREAKSLLRDIARGESVPVLWTANGLSRSYDDFTKNPALQKMRRELRRSFVEVKDCSREVAKLRALKQTDEVVLMREAINLTLEAFRSVGQKLKSYSFEYEIEADFTYLFRSSGGFAHAYEPIVAAGIHACTLHYVKNNAALPKNGLVLIDIGARVGGYAADITRTYAIGTPSAREVAVHAAVQKAHHRIIELVKPGLKLRDYSDQVDEIMKDALQELDLLKDRNDAETYRKYFPHAISHGLGLDVHESLGGYETFMPGMIFTVEPGIYIPEEGIGVRIEDDILVTKDGYKNLSGALSTDL